MVILRVLIPTLLFTAVNIAMSEGTYSEAKCRELLRDCDERTCPLEALLLCSPDSIRFAEKRATRRSIRQILVDSYLNRL
ncbi:unnamed protein product [Cylicocyclus nassatus]|uniref:Uncharacterized protein n=1 Tax=Cylicocyclus nassatus TaxID=53992 RepID=A0AA36GJZ4_CYLNA|nr:unnamed protein product [Cylicocyclus nassatus]